MLILLLSLLLDNLFDLQLIRLLVLENLRLIIDLFLGEDSWGLVHKGPVLGGCGNLHRFAFLGCLGLEVVAMRLLIQKIS